MRPVNDDGHRAGPISASAANEIAIGYVVLNELAELVGADRIRGAMAGSADADVASAIGKRVAQHLKETA